MGHGAKSAGVVFVQEFGFVGGHVDVDWTFRCACFAGKAQVKGFIDFFAAVAVGDGFTAEHFREQAGAASGGVHFVAGDLEGRAHRVGF